MGGRDTVGFDHITIMIAIPDNSVQVKNGPKYPRSVVTQGLAGKLKILLRKRMPELEVMRKKGNLSAQGWWHQAYGKIVWRGVGDFGGPRQHRRHGRAPCKAKPW